RWKGYVQPAFTETYTFRVEVNDGARLWVGGELLFDNFDEDLGQYDTAIFSTFEGSPSEDLVAGRLYPITVEFRENYGAALARLLWQSASQPPEVIPSNRLFHGSDPVRDSPFQVSIMPHKPSQPQDVFLSVEAWDEIRVSFFPPANDGGEAIQGYAVEWWPAVSEGYGAMEVQTLKIGPDVDGGELYVTSPQGYQYPRPLPWNMSANALELALESTYDVTEVDVSYEEDRNGTRSYSVTFQGETGDVNDINVDGSGLISSSGMVAYVVCTDEANSSTSAG
ncbi:unnamed protein product, partial [Discosporangium mesarthrocarpum]